MDQIYVKPNLLVWARKRAGKTQQDLLKKFPKIAEWEKGDSFPTLRQLENFAKSVYVPIGYLFFSEPPKESLPIPDFRTMATRKIAHLSPDLLDTIYLCQQRQDWYIEYAKAHGILPLNFVGYTTTKSDPITTAEQMRRVISLDIADRQKCATWKEALSDLVARLENAGVLVMASSIVGSNSHRKLRVEEFRGFALANDVAPLIFINAADSKAAQMFTLAHELAHLFLGQSAITDTITGAVPHDRLEQWCNAVAAEFLVPLDMLISEYHSEQPLELEIQRLARRFKVSTLVTLRRIYDAGLITREALWIEYQKEIMCLKELENVRGKSGGDFYRTLGARTGKRFARAVLSSTLEGQTLFQEAFRMLGVKKVVDIL